MLFLLLFSSKSIQNILILSVIVASFASAGIRPVVNRLNQDTTARPRILSFLLTLYGKIT